MQFLSLHAYPKPLLGHGRGNGMGIQHRHGASMGFAKCQISTTAAKSKENPARGTQANKRERSKQTGKPKGQKLNKREAQRCKKEREGKCMEGLKGWKSKHCL